LALALVCLLLSAHQIKAESNQTSTSPDPLLSAAEIAYPPFSIADAQGQADGFSVALLRAALKAMDREVIFRTGTWLEVKGDRDTGNDRWTSC
jgi:two-component system sensor histidine kinase EvgS